MNNNEYTDYSVKKIFRVIKLNFNFLVLTYPLIATFSLVYALNLPNIYTSKAVLYPAAIPSSAGSNSSLGSSLGGSGIADIVGSLSGSGGNQNVIKALKILESKDFYLDYYKNPEFLPLFEAAKSYNLATDTIQYDPEKYDPLKQSWIKGAKPNFDQSHSNFKSIMKIEHDRLDGFITISLDHLSPKVANYWLQEIITDINSKIKKIDTDKALAQSLYFEKKLNSTDIRDLRSVISSLLLQAYETLAFAEITDDFAFEYVDRPMEPERKSKPSRGLIVIFLCVGLGFFELLLLLALSSYQKRIHFSLFPLILKIDHFH